MSIKKYDLVISGSGCVVARTHDSDDVDYFAGDNQWCKASDVEAYIAKVSRVIDKLEASCVRMNDRLDSMEVRND